MDGNHDTSDEAYLSGGNAYVVEGKHTLDSKLNATNIEVLL